MSAGERQQQERADPTRLALLNAALAEFSSRGFEAASTRRIAERAGSQQPQINYHFDSKLELWRAVVGHLFARLNELIEAETAVEAASDDPFEWAAARLRSLVRAIAQVPELNRIMVHEATVEGERLAWIVDHFTRSRFEELAEARMALLPDSEPTVLADAVFYYSLVGAASLPYVCAPEARLLGQDPTDASFVDAHAEVIVQMFLGNPMLLNKALSEA